MTITWLGHSCFLLESGGFRALLDPYKDVRGLEDIEAEADAVYCSHGHFDHAYTDRVTLRSGGENPFAVKEIPSLHDDQGGALRGRNTIRRFQAEGVSVVHLGDLGHPLTQEQLEAVGPCDALLLPVGGTYTITAAQARETAEAVGPRVIIPMHYRRGSVGFENIQPLEAFTSLYPAELVREYAGSCLELTPDMPRQVAVLTPARGNGEKSGT